MLLPGPRVPSLRRCLLMRAGGRDRTATHLRIIYLPAPLVPQRNLLLLRCHRTTFSLPRLCLREHGSLLGICFHIFFCHHTLASDAGSDWMMTSLWRRGRFRQFVSGVLLSTSTPPLLLFYGSPIVTYYLPRLRLFCDTG